MEGLQRWRAHSAMTDPAGERSRFDGLPSDIAGLCRIVQGVLIHSDWIEAYGVDESQFSTVSRETLPLAVRLKQIGDAGALTAERATDKRAVGTCRDYALMLCAMLRHQGVAARVRCGFAAYFRRDWEDHWICEYWRDGRWRRADAQLDRVIAPRLGIGFDPTDLPADMFITAGEAWRRCRAGEADPAIFGHGETATGLWFVRVNVVRDHYVLNERVVSEWDTWRKAMATHQTLSEVEMTETDDIARRSEAPIKTGLVPSWLIVGRN